MKIKESGFEGLLIIEPRVFADSRGYFFESFNSKAFEEAGIDFKPVQDKRIEVVKRSNKRTSLPASTPCPGKTYQGC